jgi:hypothetical protein
MRVTLAILQPEGFPNGAGEGFNGLHLGAKYCNVYNLWIGHTRSLFLHHLFWYLAEHAIEHLKRQIDRFLETAWRLSRNSA